MTKEIAECEATALVVFAVASGDDVEIDTRSAWSFVSRALAARCLIGPQMIGLTVGNRCVVLLNMFLCSGCLLVDATCSSGSTCFGAIPF